MPNGEILLGNEDKAWATFKTPLDKNSLLCFCQDIERLLRINPYLVFERWEKIGDAQYHYCVVNHSQSPAFKLETELKMQTKANGIEIHYDQGIKTCTTFAVQAIPEGSEMEITERYKAITKDMRQHRITK